MPVFRYEIAISIWQVAHIFDRSGCANAVLAQSASRSSRAVMRGSSYHALTDCMESAGVLSS